MEFLTRILGISTALADTNQPSGAFDLLLGIGPMILLLVVFYFFLMRPQRKKDKKVKEMLANLKPGDRICTIGGIYGTITGLKDDTVELAVGKQDIPVVFARWAIRSVEEVAIENDAEQLT